MAKFIIKGGKPLSGKIESTGNKNAVLPCLAATLLSEGECVLSNVPQISDVVSLSEILKDLGVKIEGLGTSQLWVNSKNVAHGHLNPELVKKLRASILCLGPLLARFGQSTLRHPGGCLIGRRAVGTHFEALEALGAEIKTEGEFYEAKMIKAKSGRVFLDEASVTATENVLMLAVRTPGQTVIEDAAAEPHVEDLANFLVQMGARISGAGTSRIVVEGVKKLGGAQYTLSPDHVDVGTFAIMAGASRGEIHIQGVKPEHLSMILLYLKRMNVKTAIKGQSLVVYRSQPASCAGRFQTRPWPGFPTDLMSPFIVLATQATGVSLCHDWMYESRMFFVDRLIGMGAKITICDPHRVLVIGPTQLRAKIVDSPDIRAGMAFVAAALCAQGESVIDNIEIIERGYPNVEQRLLALGAEVKRVD